MPPGISEYSEKFLSAITDPECGGFEFLNLTNTQFGEGWFKNDFAINGIETRNDAAESYLYPFLNRTNLELKLFSQVIKVTFNNDNKATGVGYLDRSGVLRRVRAKKEVILSAGLVGSVKLLLLSGIGPKADLESLTPEPIDVVSDLLGVGKDIKDHYLCSGFEWNLNIPGFDFPPPFSFTGAEVAGHMKSNDSLENPDMYCNLIPVLTTSGFPTAQTMPAYFQNGNSATPFGSTLFCFIQHPESGGRIGITSSDPKQEPFIESPYLNDPDGKDLAKCAAFQDRILNVFNNTRGCSNFSPFINFDEFFPGPNTISIEDFIKGLGGATPHMVGGARAGPDSDPLAVVDDKLLVKGVTGLRVVDGSVFPRTFEGPPMASVYAIAEKAAVDIILAAI